MNLLDMLGYEDNISHDLRQDYIIPSLCSLEIMRNIVNDMCDFASFDMKNFELNLTQFNLIELLEECLMIFRLNAQLKKIDLGIVLNFEDSDE
jgi:signal transduction histidine kinase